MPRFNNTYSWDCPFGTDDDCVNSLVVETDEGCVVDVTGCPVHVAGQLTEKQLKKLNDMLQDVYQAQHDDDIDRRVDEMRERELEDR